MMLVAGVPHFDCRCPNGHVKPYCLALRSGKTGCCCDGSCCPTSSRDGEKAVSAHTSPSATTAKKTCCCCKDHREGTGSESRTGTGFEKAGCQKTLAEAAVAVPGPSVNESVQDLTAHLFIPTSEPALSHYGFAACDCLLANHYHWPPPPTDLVTVLQHFLI